MWFGTKQDRARMERRRGDRVRKRDAGAPRPAEAAPPATDRAVERLKKPPQFENWLSEQLKSLYDPVLEEPLPDDLMRMLEEGAKKAKPKEDKDR
jgi:hypothetical protein